jgi:hypothetical protein
VIRRAISLYGMQLAKRFQEVVMFRHYKTISCMPVAALRIILRGEHPACASDNSFDKDVGCTNMVFKRRQWQ